MAIQRTDIVYYKSEVFNDTTSNGGRRSFTAVVEGVSSNIFPIISQSERTAGSTKYRKVFPSIQDTANLKLFNAKMYIENPTQAADEVYLFAGDLTNTQNDLTGSERLYGCGWLDATVNAGATQITVRAENGANTIFAIGDEIRISDKDDIDASGNEEYRTLTGASVLSNTWTLDFSTPLENGYSASGDATRVSSILDLGDLETSSSNHSITSTNGDYDFVNYPPTLTNKGTVLQTWTLTWASGALVEVVGDNLGSLGTFPMGSDIAPDNSSTSSPYFTLPVAGFSGSFTAGDTLTFDTSPAAASIWFKRDVPAGTASFSGNRFIAVLEGESE